MRPLRLVVAAALALGAAAAPPALATRPDAPELTAKTVVTTVRSGFVDVRLPHDARLSPRFESNPDVVFRGSGRLLGLWLEPLDGSRWPGDRLESMRLPGFLGGRTQTWGSTEPGPQCSSSPLGGETCTTPTPTAVLLHAGLYRLTVLTDGHPLRITLGLRGLAGRSTVVRPTHVLASAQRSLPARESVDDKLVTYGGQGPLSGFLRTFVVATAKASGSQLDGASACERRDDGAPPPYAFNPTCPGSPDSYYRVAVAGGRYGVFGVWTGGIANHEVRSSLGGSFSNDTGVVLGPTLGVWLRVA